MVGLGNNQMEFYSLKNGTVFQTFNQGTNSAEFGDIDNAFYYISGARNLLRSIAITPPPFDTSQNPNCSTFSYTIEGCVTCKQNFTLSAARQCTASTNNTALLNNGNNVPGIDLSAVNFINSANYSVEIGTGESSRALITFNGIDGMNEFEKETYIRDLINTTTRPTPLRFAIINRQIPSWR